MLARVEPIPVSNCSRSAVLTTGADRKDVSRFQNRTDFLAG